MPSTRIRRCGRGFGFVLCLLILVAPGAAEAAARTIGYSVARSGDVDFGLGRFSRIVEATLNDRRGWSLGGKVRFRQTSGGAFQVTLASPGVVGRHGGCSSYYSCRVGGLVLINSDRWAGATPAFPGQALLHTYRQMVINHEVGHALGFGHATCTSPGLPAPVMQQQSKGLLGCLGNPWPIPRERRAFGSRIGVRPGAIGAGIVLKRRVGPVELGMRRHEAIDRIGEPHKRRAQIDRYRVPDVRIVYARGRVQSIATQTPGDLTKAGVGVGSRRRELRRAHPDAACTTRATVTRCVVGSAERVGDRPATFLIERGGVVSVEIERLVEAPAHLSEQGASS